MKSENINKLLANIATGTPTLYPQNFIALSADVFKVGSLYAPIERVLSKEEVTAMYAAAYGDNFSVLPETVEMHSRVGSRNYITGIVRANIISKPYSESAVKAGRFKTVSKNVFVDDEDNIWKVIGKGDNARLVQSKTEDFAAILRERINSLQNVVSASCVTDDLAVHDTQSGDFVLYFSKATSELDYGFAFRLRGGDFTIYSHEQKAWDDVETNQIVRAASLDKNKVKASPFNNEELGNDLVRTDGEFTRPLKNKYEEYMKFLYDGTDYFKKLKDLLGLRLQNGMDHLEVMTTH